jgi:phosphoglucosamine mutase
LAEICKKNKKLKREKFDAMKYFGTDGMRGTFGHFPANEFCFNILAQALERFCGRLERVVVGRDPRLSGEAIRNFLIAGFSPGVEIVDVGVVTSPLLSRAVGATGADFGLMITASHNPAADNGVKIFDRAGAKLSRGAEVQIESLMDGITAVVRNRGHKITPHCVAGDYAVDGRIFKNFSKIVIDCAHGAAVEFARKSYRFPAIDWIGDAPDGGNINGGCGSEYPELLAREVCERGADLGIAHDGDGDRLLLCDGRGNVLPGEIILGIIAIYLQKIKALAGQKIVTTLVSNGGLALALRERGIGVDYSDVGDRNVAEKMRDLGCNFGGERSGHLIFSDRAPTSDGIQSALLFLEAVDYLRIPPAEIAGFMPLFPRMSCDIVVKKKIPLEQLPGLSDSIAAWERRLGGEGKIFIRYSGTENKLRLLVEANSSPLAEKIMKDLKNNIENCSKII